MFSGLCKFLQAFYLWVQLGNGPLTLLNSTKVCLKWIEVAQNAFSDLHRHFTASILQLPICHGDRYLWDRSGGHSVRFLLLMISYTPTPFIPHKLTPVARNYDVGNQDLLAINLALEEWS